VVRKRIRQSGSGLQPFAETVPERKHALSIFAKNFVNVELACDWAKRNKRSFREVRPRIKKEKARGIRRYET
jgi:hypothetical protein